MKGHGAEKKKTTSTGRLNLIRLPHLRTTNLWDTGESCCHTCKSALLYFRTVSVLLMPLKLGKFLSLEGEMAVCKNSLSFCRKTPTSHHCSTFEEQWNKETVEQRCGRLGKVARVLAKASFLHVWKVAQEWHGVPEYISIRASFRPDHTAACSAYSSLICDQHTSEYCDRTRSLNQLVLHAYQVKYVSLASGLGQIFAYESITFRTGLQPCSCLLVFKVKTKHCSGSKSSVMDLVSYTHVYTRHSENRIGKAQTTPQPAMGTTSTPGCQRSRRSTQLLL